MTSTKETRGGRFEYVRSLFLIFYFSLLVLFVSLFSCAEVKAQGEGLTLAKYANDFLAIGVGGRALGMGSAYTAAANDVTSGYWNPAGLSKVEFPEIILMHDQRYGDIVSYNYVAGAIKLSKDETVGLSAVVLSVSGVPNTQSAGLDLNGNPIPPEFANPDSLSRLDPNMVTFFGETDFALVGSYAKQSTDNFAYGGSVKLIRRSIGTTSGTGIGFDVRSALQSVQESESWCQSAKRYDYSRGVDDRNDRGHDAHACDRCRI